MPGPSKCCLNLKLAIWRAEQRSLKINSTDKLAMKEQVKQEIIEEINLKKINNNVKDLNDTVYGDYSEIEKLKIENELLKQLNNELQDKHKILNELLTKEKQGNNNNNIRTSAEITANPKPKIKSVPKLIIKQTDNKDNTDLEKTVLQHLTQDKTIQTKSVSCKNKDTVIIKCMNEENIDSLVNILGSKLSNNFKIEKEQINNPKLKGIDINMDHGDDNEIESDINERNFSNMKDKCKLLHVYTNDKTKRKCAIIEVSSSIYKYVKDNKSRLFVGHQS